MPPYRNVMDSLGLDRRAPGMRACILTRLSVESLLPQARMQPARPEAACCPPPLPGSVNIRNQLHFHPGLHPVSR